MNRSPFVGFLLDEFREHETAPDRLNIVGLLKVARPNHTGKYLGQGGHPHPDYWRKMAARNPRLHEWTYSDKAFCAPRKWAPELEDAWRKAIRPSRILFTPIDFARAVPPLYPYPEGWGALIAWVHGWELNAYQMRAAAESIPTMLETHLGLLAWCLQVDWDMVGPPTTKLQMPGQHLNPLLRRWKCRAKLARYPLEMSNAEVKDGLPPYCDARALRHLPQIMDRWTKRSSKQAHLTEDQYFPTMRNRRKETFKERWHRRNTEKWRKGYARRRTKGFRKRNRQWEIDKKLWARDLAFFRKHLEASGREAAEAKLEGRLQRRRRMVKRRKT